MKILVLNGSPRPNGNTAKMVGVFREVAEKNGHEVVCFNVCKISPLSSRTMTLNS